jgi:hypothetical protein
MVKRKNLTKEDLKELCLAHTQMTQALKDHLTKSDNSKILEEMYELQIREIETKITQNLKTWIGV